MFVKKEIPIIGIIPGSIAEELGVEVGDILLSINSQSPADYIDFVDLISDEELEILIRKPDGEEWLLDFTRHPGEELGLELQGIIYDQLKECYNHCIFCFVHQMPIGLRKTLSLQDDDYRFSFLQGSFVTLTNLDDQDFERIKNLKLSPLYVSVHTTNPKLRQRIMGNKKAGKILKILKELKDAGISFHAQIVLIPGINDGAELKNSIEELASLRPNLLSLAIVPVGLTKFRTKLMPLQTYTPDLAVEVVKIVQQYQEKFNKDDVNFLYLADEFYLLTGENFPNIQEYHGFPQLENGVGLSRLLLDEFSDLESTLPIRLKHAMKILIVTGVLAGQVLSEPVHRLQLIQNLEVELLVVQNEFFGENVTVVGLLTGQDLKKSLLNHYPKEYDFIFLPSVLLNDDELFIDGMCKDEFIHDIPNAIFVNNLTQIINYTSNDGGEVE